MYYGITYDLLYQGLLYNANKNASFRSIKIDYLFDLLVITVFSNYLQ